MFLDLCRYFSEENVFIEMTTQFVMNWNLPIWGLSWGHLEEGCAVHWAQNAHTDWQGKRGGTAARAWAPEGNHSDSNNTLPLISLISSFLRLKVYYSGEISSCCVCSEWNAANLGHDSTRLRSSGLQPGIRDMFFNLHLFLSPRHQDQALVSSPPGNTESKRKRELTKWQ